MPAPASTNCLPWPSRMTALVTASQARAIGIVDSVLARLTQRGKLERVARGVYRIPYFPADRLSQYREAVLWARASHGPEQVALSHETALGVYGISDVNPARVHLTVPKNARLRRQKPKWIVIHRGELPPTRCDHPRRAAGHDRGEECLGRDGDDRKVGISPPSHQGCAQGRLHQRGGIAAAHTPTEPARARWRSSEGSTYTA